MMRYHDLTLTITEHQGQGYDLTAISSETGRVSVILPLPSPELQAQLGRMSALPRGGTTDAAARAAGEALFRWIAAGPVESHLRVAWDRAQRSRAGLRIRLSIDPPEIAAWPWELLRDPGRGHIFATSPNTLLVRYYDQTEHFGSLVEQETDLPLNLLLVLPTTPDLQLDQERQNIERVVAMLPDVLRLHVLDGTITRTALTDALLVGDYDIVHFSGHGTFREGRGYIGLNRPDGKPDWMDGAALSQIAVNYESTRLVILNACSSGRVDDARAFQGLAPQLVRFGVPAVIAMQYPIGDEAAITFAHEFYKSLCLGDGAGQVDVAVAYARSMLAIVHPHSPAWSTPVLYTHAADGVIYRLTSATDNRSALDPILRRARLETVQASLDESAALHDDFKGADATLLFSWRQTLRRAEESYRARLNDPQPEARELAQRGLDLIQQRLVALDAALTATARR
jgi:hypothetical protein